MKLMNMTLDERRKMILEGNIMRTLIFLSIPTVLMSIVQAMLPFSDTYYLNNYAGYVVASAISFSQPIINTINSMSLGLGVAVMAIVGQLNGKGDIEEAKRVSIQVIVFSFILSIIFIPIIIAIAYAVSQSLNRDISGYVFKYLSLYSIVLPVLFFVSIFNAIKNALGNPESIFLRMVILLILKITFNYIFLVRYRLGIEGSVLATVISAMLIAIWMFFDLFVIDSEFKLTFKNFKFDFEVIKNVFKIAVPSILSSMMMYLGFILINIDIQRYGTEALNAQGISSGINAMTFTVPSSISTTVTTMVSMNVGIGNGEKAKKVFKKGMLLGLMIALVIFCMFYPASRRLVYLFQRSDQVIIQYAIKSLKIYTMSIIPFTVFSVVQGAYIGLGRTKAPLFTGVLRIWVFRIVFIKLTESYLGVYSVYWGNLFSNFLAALVFLIMISRIKWVSIIKNR